MDKASALFLAFFFLSCSQGEDRQDKRTSLLIYERAEEETEGVFCSKLVAEMKSLSAKLDTLTSNSMGIVAILISREDKECMMVMATQPFYDRKRLDGAFLVGGRLFAFYIEETICNMGIVHLDQLRALQLERYPNESNFKPLGSYEPWGRKYKIHGQDSLELVHEGYL